jgi:hypothetical protein
MCQDAATRPNSRADFAALPGLALRQLDDPRGDDTGCFELDVMACAADELEAPVGDRSGEPARLVGGASRCSLSPP